MRLAVRISFSEEGELRANSRAHERPMPEDAPVIRMVLAWRFWAVEVGIVVSWVGCGDTGWGV